MKTQGPLFKNNEAFQDGKSRVASEVLGLLSTGVCDCTGHAPAQEAGLAPEGCPPSSQALGPSFCDLPSGPSLSPHV